MVARKGDARAGAVLVKVFNPRTVETKLYGEALRGDGESFWMQPSSGKSEEDLDAYVARTVKIDPDVWLVAIEDVEGRHFLMEPVEEK